MAQRRTTRQSGIKYGKSGLGKLVKLDDARARIDFDDGQSVSLNVVIGDIWENESATMPNYVPFKAMKPNSFLNVRVSLAEGDKRILFINPASGEMRVKFVKFQAPEGSEPTWAEKEGAGKKTYRETNPFVEVIEGRWKGLQIRGRLFDNFGKDDEDGNTTIYFGKKGTSSQNLEDFCVCVGFEYWNTPYSENLLPEIQRTALQNDNSFSIILVNGYIANWVSGLNEADTFNDGNASSENTTQSSSPSEALLED